MELALVQQENRNDADGIEMIGRVPAAAGSRLQFSYGSGMQVRVCEVQSPSTAAGGEDPYAGFLEW
jgi:hypothetical protein